jgi:hypothetical protein
MSMAIHRIRSVYLVKLFTLAAIITLLATPTNAICCWTCGGCPWLECGAVPCASIVQSTGCVNPQYCPPDGLIITEWYCNFTFRFVSCVDCCQMA